MKKILVLLAVPILILALSGCVLKKKDTAETSTTSQESATTQLTTTQATTQTTEFLDRFSKAVTRAKQDFKDDAALVSIEVIVPADLDINLAKERFIFASPSDDNWLYVLAYNTQTDKIERSFTFMQDYMGGTGKPKALDASSVKKGWAEAIYVAQSGSAATSSTTGTSSTGSTSAATSSNSTASTASSSIPSTFSWVTVGLVPSSTTGQPAWSITFEGISPKTVQVNAATGQLEGAGATSTETTSPAGASESTTGTTSTTAPSTSSSGTTGSATTTTTPSSSSSTPSTADTTEPPNE